MANELLQDMVRVKRSRTVPVQKRIRERPAPQRVQKPKKEQPQRVRKSKFGIYFIAFFAVVALLFSLSFLFSKVKITIAPKTAEVSLNGDFSASKDAKNASLSFDLVVISGEQEKTIQGGEMKDVSVASKGTVILYNAFSSNTQGLDIDTRLAGSNGKIYKTNKKVVIPGVSPDGKPGSVEVGIYASEAGEAYDSGPLDFNIVGFKGSSKYSKFYARSKGNITGGFVGKAPVVSDLEKASASNELRALLEAKLLKKVIDQIPSGFVLYEDAILLDIGENSTTYTPAEDNKVTAKLKGTLYGFIFDEQKLTKKIASDALEGYDNEDLYVPNIKGLSFSFLNKENVNFSNIKSINFNITGEPYFVYRVDEKKLRSQVLHKEKKQFDKILALHPNIESAEIVFRPFWKRTFPELEEDIEITVNYPL